MQLERMEKARICDVNDEIHTFENVLSIEHDEEEGEIRVRLPVGDNEHATKYEYIEPGYIERVW
jgi:hypothetical protein